MGLLNLSPTARDSLSVCSQFSAIFPPLPLPLAWHWNWMDDNFRGVNDTVVLVERRSLFHRRLVCTYLCCKDHSRENKWNSTIRAEKVVTLNLARSMKFLHWVFIYNNFLLQLILLINFINWEFTLVIDHLWCVKYLVLLNAIKHVVHFCTCQFQKTNKNPFTYWLILKNKLNVVYSP